MIRLFWTYTASLTAKAITHATRSQWGHVGILVGQDAAYEARAGKGFCSDSFSSVLNYSLRRPGSLVAISAPLEIPAGWEPQIIEAIEAAVGHRSYSRLQLIAIAANIRYGIPVPRGDKRWICSEAVARLLHLEDAGYRIYDRLHPTPDSVSPGSLWVSICEKSTVLTLFTGRSNPMKS